MGETAIKFGEVQIKKQILQLKLVNLQIKKSYQLNTGNLQLNGPIQEDK